MSWIVDSTFNFFQKLLVNVLKCGPIPKHVAFIVDGNRRYALKNKFEKKSAGHRKGFEKVAQTIRWCIELGISEITLYLFSIDNFKRHDDEVVALMELATEKFRRLIVEEKDKFMEEGICFRVVGNMSLLSKELQKILAEGMLATKDNNRFFLNVAFAYTSQEEITHATKTVVEGVRKKLIRPEDIDEDLFSACLYTAGSPNPDIIVRTSGEVRFSNFLLWQISNSYVYFTEVLWPELGTLQALDCLLKYQRCYKELLKSESPKNMRNERVEKFLEELEQRKLAQLESYLL